MEYLQPILEFFQANGDVIVSILVVTGLISDDMVALYAKGTSELLRGSIGRAITDFIGKKIILFGKVFLKDNEKQKQYIKRLKQDG